MEKYQYPVKKVIDLLKKQPFFIDVKSSRIRTQPIIIDKANEYQLRAT